MRWLSTAAARACDSAATSSLRMRRAASSSNALHAFSRRSINASTRDVLHKKVIAGYHEEIEKSKQPGYHPVEIYDSPEDYDA